MKENLPDPFPAFTARLFSQFQARQAACKRVGPPMLFERQGTTYRCKNPAESRWMIICVVHPDTGGIYARKVTDKLLAHVDDPWILTECLRIEDPSKEERIREEAERLRWEKLEQNP